MRNTRPYRVERRFLAPRLAGPISWLSTGLLASILMIGAFVQDVRSNDHVVDGNYCTATAEVALSACEISLNYEIPDGEDEAELVDIEGSWKAFRDHAKPGIVMFADPQVGVVYRQEMALGNAEDVAEILSITANEAAPEAGIACNNDCVMTQDYSPVEPGVFEHKFYAPGVGFIVEVKPETGERLELVSMTP